MRHLQYTTAALAGLSVVAVIGLSACSKDEEESTTTDTTTSSAAATTSAEAPPAGGAAGPVGPGCEAYVAANPAGSPGGTDTMAAAPVATAASGNPELSTLVSALSGQLNPGVNLVDTLNNGEYTVFAPTNAAFEKLEAGAPGTTETLKTDAELLKSILTYHVISGPGVKPDAITAAPLTSLQGGAVTVTGASPTFTVNEGTPAAAGVVCGGVNTANAQVYMIDTVLSPPAS